eukprot:2916999-Pleurochrysis_carterae.AAC.1
MSWSGMWEMLDSRAIGHRKSARGRECARQNPPSSASTACLSMPSTISSAPQASTSSSAPLRR